MAEFDSWNPQESERVWLKLSPLTSTGALWPGDSIPQTHHHTHTNDYLRKENVETELCIEAGVWQNDKEIDNDMLFGNGYSELD